VTRKYKTARAISFRSPKRPVRNLRHDGHRRQLFPARHHHIRCRYSRGRCVRSHIGARAFLSKGFPTMRGHPLGRRMFTLTQLAFCPLIRSLLTRSDRTFPVAHTGAKLGECIENAASNCCQRLSSMGPGVHFVKGASRVIPRSHTTRTSNGA